MSKKHSTDIDRGSALSPLKSRFVHAIKAPALQFNALNKAQKSRMLYQVLAVAGGCLALTAPIAVYAQDAIMPTVEAIKTLPEFKNISDVTMILPALDPIMQAMKPVAGTATSGLWVCLSNIGLSKVFSKKADMDDADARQENRLKEVFANAVGVVRWIPQYIQGRLTPGFETETAALTAMGGYGIGVIKQGVEYLGRKRDEDFSVKKLSEKLDSFMRTAPGVLMIGRGPVQGLAAVTSGAAVHPSIAIIWGTAAIVQTVGGFMQFNKDQPFKKPNPPAPV
jgi:hypothetical protein